MQNKGKITILGSFVTDLMSYAPHIPVNGETVKGGPFHAGPGGKGSNQGIAARRAGADVTMITKLGKDAFADFAWKSFREAGMKTDYVYTDKENGTGTALIIVDAKTAENVIVVCPGACENIKAGEIDRARGDIMQSDIFLTQFENNMDAVEYAADIAWKSGVRILLNPAPVKPVSDGLYKKIYAITPNETEAASLSGVATDTMSGVKEAARFFRSMGVRAAVITLGKKGVYISSDEFEGMIDIIDAGKAVDTTGAGDAFNGGFAAGLAEGKSLREAAVFGSAVAGIAVTRVGTAPAMPYRQEVEELLKNKEEA